MARHRTMVSYSKINAYPVLCVLLFYPARLLFMEIFVLLYNKKVKSIMFKHCLVLVVLFLCGFCASCTKSEELANGDVSGQLDMSDSVKSVPSDDSATVTGSNFVLEQYLTKSVTNGQGMDITGNLVFVLSDGGTCNVYDFVQKLSQPVGSFNLGSKRSGNHCNCANFGVETKTGASFPLLYVSNGKVGDTGEWVLNVESITRAGNTFSSELVQTITMDQSDYAANSLQPIWGCPNWVVDKERKYLWAFSAIKRTTLAGTGTDMSSNKYIATKFRLPALSEGSAVVFKAADVLDQVSFVFDTYITQGGTMKDGKIYYAFCYGGSGTQTPSRIRVYDTDTHTICASYELEGYVAEEMEDLSLYNGKLYINTNSAKFYELTSDALATGIRPVRVDKH